MVSDTHGYNDNLVKVLEREKPIDLLIHCGDVSMTEYELATLADVPVHVVSGNCDYFYDLSPVSIFDYHGHKIFVTHGHNYKVDWGYDNLCYRAQELKADIVMFGHTHVPVYKEIEGVTIINPGSLSRPRQIGGEPTYAVLEIDNQKKTNIEIKSI